MRKNCENWLYFLYTENGELDWNWENWKLRGKMVILYFLYWKHWKMIFCINGSWKQALKCKWVLIMENGNFRYKGLLPVIGVCVCVPIGVMVGRASRVARLVVQGRFSARTTSWCLAWPKSQRDGSVYFAAYLTWPGFLLWCECVQPQP